MTILRSSSPYFGMAKRHARGSGIEADKQSGPSGGGLINYRIHRPWSLLSYCSCCVLGSKALVAHPVYATDLHRVQHRLGYRRHSHNRNRHQARLRRYWCGPCRTSDGLRMSLQERFSVTVVLLGVGTGAFLVAQRPSFWIEFGSRLGKAPLPFAWRNVSAAFRMGQFVGSRHL